MAHPNHQLSYLLRGLPVLAILLAVACLRSAGAEQPLETASHVDLKRYLGKWYEIARLPLSWENKCAADVTATYTLRADGKTDVLNVCRKANGKLTQSKGTARIIAKDGSNAKLKVTFFWPFSGDYWILDLDPDYRWAIVGATNRRYFWLLSRTPQLPQRTVNEILSKMQRFGFETNKVIYTKHSQSTSPIKKLASARQGDTGEKPPSVHLPFAVSNYASQPSRCGA